MILINNVACNNLVSTPRRYFLTISKSILLFISLAYSVLGFANSALWHSPLAEPNNSNIYSSDTEFVSKLTLSAASYSSLGNGSSDEYIGDSYLSYSQELSENSAVALEFSNAREQKNYLFGYTNNAISLSYISGSAENYFELGGAYTNVDPYLFHGGWHQKMRYNGFGIDYNFKRIGHLQFGQAKIESDGLLDRKAQYVEWSNQQAFVRLTDYSRGTSSIGNGLDAGFAFSPNKVLAFQSMRVGKGRSMDRIRFQFNGKNTRQYWLDFSSHRNPLFRDNDDYRVMFSFKTLLGAKTLASYAAEPSEAEAETSTKKNKALGRGVFIGLGVAAGAALASSGSDSNDNNTRLLTQRDAAFEVLNDINPVSVRENREYGGWVFLNADGSYSYSNPVRGEAASVLLPNPTLVTPAGGQLSASYHTHAAFDPRYDNENFSPTDLDLNRSFNVDGYLATPGGQFKWHNIRTDGVVTLGSIANN